MYLSNYILKAGNVLFEDGFEVVDIQVEDGIITKIDKELNVEEGYKVLDCKNLIITPGFMDVHVHLRDPGFTHKEDIETGEKAALRGGFTTIYAMPNTNPIMDSEQNIKEFNGKVKDLDCNIKTFSAISKGLKGDELVNIKKISKLNIAGFSDDGVGLKEESKIKEAINEIKNTNCILSVHAEDITELPKQACVNEGRVSKEYNLPGINNASEYNMVQRDLNLLKDTNLKYHVCHVSTKETVKLITEAKAQGLDVSMEVTPHHLVLIDEDIKPSAKNILDTNYKMNPPLREKEDRKALIKALKEGKIEIIATDHAPHQKEEKDTNFKDAPFGIIGLQMAYSVLNTYLVKKDLIPEQTILKALTYGPAKRFGENKKIAVGQSVDLTILDCNKDVVFTEENIVSKSKNSPFLNKELKGKICKTLLKNKIYDWSENE